jgi:very-short-patch-repair endonuclease
MTEMPADLPVPLMYGPSFPKLKLLMRDGRQGVESATNQNLVLTPEDFTDSGTFTMSRFLGLLDPCRRCACPPSGHVGEGDVADASAYCDLALDVEFDDDSYPTWQIWQPPNFWQCPAWERLQNFCSSEAQREFFEKYCVALADHAVDRAYTYARGVIETNDVVKRRYQLGYLQTALRDVQLDFPALIPEAWLNYIGWDKTDEDVQHLSENPQRVDFVMFADGLKCVIEIDGPSHYADFDEGTRRYTVSEERYTRNLRIERSLRRQNWQIYRFSNLEVTSTPKEEFADLVADLPGVRPYRMNFTDLWDRLHLTDDDIPF